MKVRELGMVLLITVMMMSLLTLFILTLLQAVFLCVKVNHQVQETHQAFHQLEATASRLMLEGVNPECVFTNENPNHIIRLVSNHGGCSLTDNQHRYDYLMDDLGLYPCLKIRSTNQLLSSHHWLITIASTSSKASILQLRIAKPDKVVACGEASEHLINAGVISWRYL